MKEYFDMSKFNKEDIYLYSELDRIQQDIYTKFSINNCLKTPLARICDEISIIADSIKTMKEKILEKGYNCNILGSEDLAKWPREKQVK